MLTVPQSITDTRYVAWSVTRYFAEVYAVAECVQSANVIIYFHDFQYIEFVVWADFANRCTKAREEIADDVERLGRVAKAYRWVKVCSAEPD